jgi:hypothetical protein
MQRHIGITCDSRVCPSTAAVAAITAAAAAPRLPADLGSLSVLQHLDVSKNMLWALPHEVRG